MDLKASSFKERGINGGKIIKVAFNCGKFLKATELWKC
jgi:hypothetical protein